LIERDHVEDTGVDGRIIQNGSSKKWVGYMDWNAVA
jgi:hypothetical protein